MDFIAQSWELLIQYGAIGIMLGVCLFVINKLLNKIFTVVENNTVALIQLKDIVQNKCVLNSEKKMS